MCLRAEVGHAAAGKEMRCNPPRLATQATSVVANWPPSDSVFLDICCRGPDSRPSFQAIIATVISQAALLPVLRRLDVQNRVVTADMECKQCVEDAGGVFLAEPFGQMRAFNCILRILRRS